MDSQTKTWADEVFQVPWALAFPYISSSEKIEIRRINGWAGYLFALNQYDRFFDVQNIQGELLPKNEGAPAVRNFYEKGVDAFGYFYEGQMVGVTLGHLLDWETYYIRMTGIFLEHQGQGFTPIFFKRLVKVLQQACIEKIIIETAPVNRVMIGIANELGFKPSGMSLHDRWGARLQFIYFLQSKKIEQFQKQFCFNLSPKTSEA